MDAYDRCTNVEKQMLPILLPSMVAENFSDHPRTPVIISRSFLCRELYKTEVVNKIKTHIVFNDFLFQKSCGLRDNAENFCRRLQATDDDITHAHFMLDT
jgi:hypothetical protein